MKYAIFSDLHANESAFKAALADARACGAEKFVCLGDVVGYGPLPSETAALARESCELVLAGNHDDAVSGRMSAEDFIDLAGEAVARHREALSGDTISWLRSLPYTAEIEGAVLTHGDLTSPEVFGYLDDEAAAAANFAASEAPFVFCGHTHVPGIFLTDASGVVARYEAMDISLVEGQRCIVNPGSVGYPRQGNGECFSTYVLYDSSVRSIHYRRLPFAVSSVMQRGAAPKRIKRGWLAALITAVALLAGGAAWLLAPTRQGAEDSALIVEMRKLPLEKDLRHVRANLQLEKDSSAVQLKVKFSAADGQKLGEEQITVKQASSRQFAIPKDAVEAEFSVLKLQSEVEPRIKSFLPTASVK